ncbi:hypothetical protein RB195_003756 [Necator americanus]|uniref:Clc-like protein n=1 Tax=Necator americanus TaxID=51031 RepID=A0ABR1DQT0_NECAM
MADGSASKCGRRAALSTFFFVTFATFTLSLISVISPSWQYVYLENGRTEHHHGLWLDCKRDYSFDYGRTKEYYETLYRRDLQGSPFDIFFLPPLQCVYKFDYYIDPEDLYDHNHDENRIQNDAYQHLFLGWKIAALSGCGSALAFSASALLFAVCAFCHRTFICASTVLVTLAAILSTTGIAIFYAWANYQDNKVIKEEDEYVVYEQMLGWAFYCQVVTTIMHWLSSILGCCVTSVSFTNTRAKVVKIEVVTGGDDSQLLSRGSSLEPFRRSFSAVYCVDPRSLRHWERQRTINEKEQQQRKENDTFKRTASVPYYSKKQKAAVQKKLVGRSIHDLFSSNSNITETTRTGSLSTLEPNQSQSTGNPASAPSYRAGAKLKPALKMQQQSRKCLDIDDNDITYEYLPCDNTSENVSCFTGGRYLPSQRMYDPVYEQINQEAYLEPDSVRLQPNNASIAEVKRKALPATQPHSSPETMNVSERLTRTTTIGDVAKASSSFDEHKHRKMPTAPYMEEIYQAENHLQPQENITKKEATEKPTSEVFLITAFMAKGVSICICSFFFASFNGSLLSLNFPIKFGVALVREHDRCGSGTKSANKRISNDFTNQMECAALEEPGSDRVLGAPLPLKQISVEKLSSSRFQDVVDHYRTNRGDVSHLWVPSKQCSEKCRSNYPLDNASYTGIGIAINTFTDHEKEKYEF